MNSLNGSVEAGQAGVRGGGSRDSGEFTASVAHRFQAAISLATVVMLLASWPLWVEPSSLPRVPFVHELESLPPGWSWVRFVVLIVALLVAAAGWGSRWALVTVLGLLVWMVVEDQHRFQPWAYQFLMAGLALATTRPPRALSLCRWFLIGLYFHSGLSKLDQSFASELGPRFLAIALRPWGVHPWEWPSVWRTVAVLAMPSAEVLVALGLAFQNTRRWALAGALTLHATLIGILGPWGLAQSAIVLIWNGSLIVEDLLLFWPRTKRVPWRWRSDEGLWMPATSLLSILALVLPLGERWGLLDSWPAFALYASHAERMELLIHKEEVARIEESVHPFLWPVAGGTWNRLDLTAWSRTVRGVPVYPQNRAGLGLAEGLLARNPDVRLFRVVLWERAHWRTGERSQSELLSLDEIRRFGDSYLFNARAALNVPLEREHSPVHDRDQ
jgi:hypothetical protein